VVNGEHPWIRRVPCECRHLIQAYLRVFASRCPADFDLRYASTGNLVFAGCYLAHQCRLQPALLLISQLAAVRGQVYAVAEQSYHLVAKYADGTVVAGQHLITSGHPDPHVSIAELYLAESEDPAASPVAVPAASNALKAVSQADLIVYPMGSFYTSVLANLLPRGVGKAVRQSRAPKILIVNDRQDAESMSLSANQMVDEIVRYARQSDPKPGRLRDYLDFVLINSRRPDTGTVSIDTRALEDEGLQVLSFPLTRPGKEDGFHPRRLSEILLSFC
jgi:CofD-related protein of GAK system